ncbi:type III pantothenate kinase [Listeria fleischmannii]|jgi:type III pantothenate kinase|uniref:type III pantothenate kinase n=1 Tax=Listeria fleischmannii TaxID=1069827 RepID=UPI001624B40E|nr:type III pantothenate kinase [Listeria fleischmannii]MBC1419682.1 type III pantothenate kinase [Listeria fleischmannii]
MILVIDVGNTNCTFGIYANEELKHHFRIATNKTRTADELGMLVLSFFNYAHMPAEEVTDVVICSVVPPAMHAVQTMSKRYFQVDPLIVGPGIKTGLNLKVENPRELGADRIVNAVAALSEYKSPIIIVDFGTATTFCYIDEKGVYQGGAIAPGIMTATEALYNHAAKLPRVDIKASQNVIGKSTVSSMQAGIYYGFIGQCEGIISVMKKEAGVNPIVVATGGLARLITEKSTLVDVVDPFLTLKGLYVLYKRNKGEMK